jgi:hypothetical protein
VRYNCDYSHKKLRTSFALQFFFVSIEKLPTIIKGMRVKNSLKHLVVFTSVSLSLVTMASEVVATTTTSSSTCTAPCINGAVLNSSGQCIPACTVAGTVWTAVGNSGYCAKVTKTVAKVDCAAEYAGAAYQDNSGACVLMQEGSSTSTCPKDSCFNGTTQKCQTYCPYSTDVATINAQEAKDENEMGKEETQGLVAYIENYGHAPASGMVPVGIVDSVGLSVSETATEWETFEKNNKSQVEGALAAAEAVVANEASKAKTQSDEQTSSKGKAAVQTAIATLSTDEVTQQEDASKNGETKYQFIPMQMTLSDGEVVTLTSSEFKKSDAYKNAKNTINSDFKSEKTIVKAAQKAQEAEQTAENNAIKKSTDALNAATQALENQVNAQSGLVPTSKNTSKTTKKGADEQADKKKKRSSAQKEENRGQETPVEEASKKKNSAEEKGAAQETAKEKAADEKAADEKAADEKAADEKAADEKAAEEEAAQEKATEEEATKEKAAQEKAAAAQKAATPDDLALVDKELQLQTDVVSNYGGSTPSFQDFETSVDGQQVQVTEQMYDQLTKDSSITSSSTYKNAVSNLNNAVNNYKEQLNAPKLVF